MGWCSLRLLNLHRASLMFSENVEVVLFRHAQVAQKGHSSLTSSLYGRKWRICHFSISESRTALVEKMYRASDMTLRAFASSIDRIADASMPEDLPTCCRYEPSSFDPRRIGVLTEPIFAWMGLEQVPCLLFSAYGVPWSWELLMRVACSYLPHNESSAYFEGVILDLTS